MTKDDGESGIVFRMRDEFNFYMFSITSSDITFVKVKNGVRTDVNIMEIDLLKDKW
jgi:hypothetical protein